jgi:hypothetical protein
MYFNRLFLTSLMAWAYSIDFPISGQCKSRDWALELIHSTEFYGKARILYEVMQPTQCSVV